MDFTSERQGATLPSITMNVPTPPAASEPKRSPTLVVPLNPSSLQRPEGAVVREREILNLSSQDLATQALLLGIGRPAFGREPRHPLCVLVIAPEGTVLSERMMQQAAVETARGEPEATESVLENYAAAARRVIVRCLPQAAWGRHALRAIADGVDEHQPDLLLLHDAPVYLNEPWVAVDKLRRALDASIVPAEPPPVLNSPSAIGTSLQGRQPRHNIVLFTDRVFSKDMPTAEAGPAAWTEYVRSGADLLRDAALNTLGRPGLLSIDKPQRVTIFSPYMVSLQDMQMATAWALRKVSPPSAARDAVNAVQWIPVPRNLSLDELAKYIGAESAHGDVISKDHIVALWQFRQFGLADHEAASFVSRAILGYECVIE